MKGPFYTKNGGTTLQLMDCCKNCAFINGEHIDDMYKTCFIDPCVQTCFMDPCPCMPPDEEDKTDE